MAAGSVSRALVVAAANIRGTLQGTAWLGLAGAALVYPLLVVAIASAGFSGLDLLSASETLFSGLFLPVILLLVCLVQGVSLFRTELEEDTLLYPLKRTVPRPSLVAGKYLGFLSTTLLGLLPSALAGIALGAILGHGPTVSSAALYEAITLQTVLGTVAYGGAFLLLGLLTRSALVVGLVYGFLWETFVSLIPGPIHQWTMVYYLRGIGFQLVTSGLVGSSTAPVSIPATTFGIVVFALACLAVASLTLRYTETRAAAAPT